MYEQLRQSISESPSAQWRLADIFYLMVLALLVYGLILTTNRIIPNIDHVTHFRWLTQFYAALNSGVIYPRWMASAQLGLGEAHYSAYPLYYYTSAIFMGLGFSPWATIKAMAVLSASLGAVVVYFEFQPLFGRKTAFLSACFWQLSPFPFFLVSNYGALPWSFSLFLALQFILISILPMSRFSRVKIALLAMALVFSHVLVAFMTFISLGIMMTLLAVKDASRRLSLLKFWALPTLAGVFLTAFHFVPTLAGHSLLTGNPENALTYLNWRNSFVFPTFSYMLWGGRWLSIQWIYPGLALFGALACSLVLWRCKGNQDKTWRLLYALTMLTFVGLALGSEIAFPLYFFESPLRSLQWPYRFVTIGVIGASLALPIAMHLCHRERVVIGIVVRAIVIAAIVSTVAVFGALQLQLIREGSDPQLNASRLAGEFHQEGNQFATTGPRWREYVQEGGLDALCRRVRATCVEGDSKTQYRVWKIDAKQTIDLVFPLFAFPAWVVRLDGAVTAFSIDKDTGLIAVTIPQGKRIIEIELLDMPQSRTGLMASLLGLLGLLWLTVLDFRLAKKETHTE